jgi:hypothetical protein
LNPLFALDQAYRATDYHVRLPVGEIILRVGQAAPFLDAWLARENLECWAILTAWNPGSVLRPAMKNRQSQEALRHLLRERGLRIFPGENRAQDGNWPPEATFFVPALAQDAALDLARAFGQNAVLWGKITAPPCLFWVLPTLPQTPWPPVDTGCAGDDVTAMIPPAKSRVYFLTLTKDRETGQSLWTTGQSL